MAYPEVSQVTQPEVLVDEPKVDISYSSYNKQNNSVLKGQSVKQPVTPVAQKVEETVLKKEVVRVE